MKKYQPPTAAAPTRRSRPAASPPRTRPAFDDPACGGAGRATSAVGGRGARRGVSPSAAEGTGRPGAGAGVTTRVGAAAPSVGASWTVGAAAGRGGQDPGAVASSVCLSVGDDPGRLKASRSSASSRPVW